MISWNIYVKGQEKACDWAITIELIFLHFNLPGLSCGPYMFQIHETPYFSISAVQMLELRVLEIIAFNGKSKESSISQGNL